MRVLLLILLLCGATTVEVSAQHTTQKKAAPSTPASAPAAKLTPASLHTESLNYGDDLKRIYVGDFEHVGFKPDSTELGFIVGGFMKVYSESCDRYLPKDKVEIMTQECSREVWTVNGYGVEQPGSRHCASWRTVGTGRYADPRVYSLNQKLDANVAGGMMSDVLNGLKQQGGDPAGGTRKMTDVVVYVKQDMDHFLDDNGCASGAIVRFQANMLRFGRGEEPIRMSGGAEAVAATTKLASGQNYERLVDDLISQESSAWMMNRYSSGSAVVNAVQHDSGGQTRQVDARYRFMTMGHPGMGNVRVMFGDGIPQCLYFSDFPSTCRAPSPKVVSDYKRNQYADAKAPTYPENAPAEPPRPQPQTLAAQPGMSMPRNPAMADTAAGDVAARQAAIRPGAPFNLAVQTVDLINESNAASGGTFRATVQRPVVLKDAVLQAGTTVYLQVQLDQRSGGPRARLDLYNISVTRVESEGKTIAVTSQPIRMTRQVVNRPPSLSGALYRAPEDMSAIRTGTSMNFFCQQTPNEGAPSSASPSK
jgi:hypothetical protein